MRRRGGCAWIGVLVFGRLIGTSYNRPFVSLRYLSASNKLVVFIGFRGAKQWQILAGSCVSVAWKGT